VFEERLLDVGRQLGPLRNDGRTETLEDALLCLAQHNAFIITLLNRGNGATFVLPSGKGACERIARIVAHAQAGVTATEWIFTLPAILLVIAGGYGMAIQAGHDLTSSWLMRGQVLFALSGLIWLFILVPLQVRQARLAKNLSPDRPIDEHYRQLGRRWLVWGIAATFPLIAATYVMRGDCPH
jgi:uncharacterized membrane protein